MNAFVARVPMIDYLRHRYQIPEPEWLRAFRAMPRKDCIQNFLSSRIVFYPGAYADGHPVKVFNKAHAAYAYIYVDYNMERKDLEDLMTPCPGNPARGFLGYSKVASWDVPPTDLVSGPLHPHVRPHEVDNANAFVRDLNGYAAFFVFERLPEFGDDHGARRFALLYLKADGFAAYDALFCQETSVAYPFCVVVQDHAFGGNWNAWDRRGVLERIAQRAKVMPQLLLVAECSRPWDGYRRATHDGTLVHFDVGGGFFEFRRRLYEWSFTDNLNFRADDVARSFFFYSQWPHLQEGGILQPETDNADD